MTYKKSITFIHGQPVCCGNVTYNLSVFSQLSFCNVGQTANLLGLQRPIPGLNFLASARQYTLCVKTSNKNLCFTQLPSDQFNIFRFSES